MTYRMVESPRQSHPMERNLLMTDLAANLALVHERIAAAAARSDRPADAVR